MKRNVTSLPQKDSSWSLTLVSYWLDAAIVVIIMSPQEEVIVVIHNILLNHGNIWNTVPSSLYWSQNRHALLDVTPGAAARLHRSRWHPIVIFLQPDSRVGLRAMRRRLCPASDKSSQRLYDQAIKLQRNYSFLFTGVVWVLYHLRRNILSSWSHHYCLLHPHHG